MCYFKKKLLKTQLIRELRTQVFDTS